MAASKLSTQDSAISRLLSIHVPSLYPPESQDMDVAPRVQTAALLGLGLLYCGTAHRQMAEVLLAEIGRKPIDDRQCQSQPRVFERESHALAAGLALGFVTLGTSGEAPGLTDLDIPNRLLRYVHASGQCVDSFPALDKSREKVKSNTVLEYTEVNVDVTTPGALAALALLYLKSNDTAMAAHLTLPNSIVLLENIRPDILLLRVLARSLILWESVMPNEEWVFSQIPSTILKFRAQLENPSKFQYIIENDDNFPTIKHAYYNILAGGCLSIGLRFAGTAHKIAFDTLRKFIQYFEKLQRQKLDKIDKVTIGNALDSLIVALSLVMAGTGNLECFRIFRRLRKKVSNDMTYGHHMAVAMAIGFLFLGGGRFTLNTTNESIAALLCAVFPIWPHNSRDNRYHLQVMRHFYVLAAVPRRVEVYDVESGRPLYVPMAIHLNPRVTPPHYALEQEEGGLQHFRDTDDKTSNNFPQNSTVIRLIAPSLLPPLQWIAKIEISSPRYWSITIPQSFFNLTRYQNHRHAVSNGTFETTDSSPFKQCAVERRPLFIYLKRKLAYLDYDLDPNGYRSLSSHSLLSLSTNLSPFVPSENNSDVTEREESTQISSFTLRQKSRADFFRAFSADESILSFTKYFCQSQYQNNTLNTMLSSASLSLSSPTSVSTTESTSGVESTSLSNFCTSLLNECLTQEKLEALPVYLFLYNVLQFLQSRTYAPQRQRNNMTPFDLWNVKLILQLYSLTTDESKERLWCPRPLLRLEFIDNLKLQLSAYFSDDKMNNYSLWLREYVTKKRLPVTDFSQRQRFCWYLTYFELPTPDVMAPICSELSRKKRSVTSASTPPPTSSTIPSSLPVGSSQSITLTAAETVTMATRQPLSSCLLLRQLLDMPIARRLPIFTLLRIIDYCLS
jgi:anaphase-promoting complex subunit 1